MIKVMERVLQLYTEFEVSTKPGKIRGSEQREQQERQDRMHKGQDQG